MNRETADWLREVGIPALRSDRYVQEFGAYYRGVDSDGRVHVCAMGCFMYAAGLLKPKPMCFDGYAPALLAGTPVSGVELFRYTFNEDTKGIISHNDTYHVPFSVLADELEEWCDTHYPVVDPLSDFVEAEPKAQEFDELSARDLHDIAMEIDAIAREMESVPA